MHTMNEEEEAAQALEETGNYRVLRRLEKWVDREPPATGFKIGAFVDVETTGLDHDKDAIIELGIVLFQYDAAGVYTVSDIYQSFDDPGFPIPPLITDLTGITDDMVKGQSLDIAEIDEMIGVANFVVAHKAAFDRKFIEKIAPVAIEKPWGCSMTQIPWKEEGWRGQSLEFLGMKAGFFFDGHRAADDCLAGIKLLSTPLPRSGIAAMTALRQTAAKPTARIYAQGSPYETKDALKARGYSWSDGTGTQPKAWYIDVSPDKVDEENAYLSAGIYGRPVAFVPRMIDFYSRFSVRE